MADQAKPAPAPNPAAAPAAKIDTRKVEQEVSWIGGRLREKSTYAGLAMLLGLAGLGADAGPLANAISLIGMGIGGLLAVVMPENGSKKIVAFLLIGAALALGFQPAHAQGIGCASCSPYPETAASAPPAAHIVRRKTTAHVAAASVSSSKPLYNTTTTPVARLTATQATQNPLVLLQNFATADLQAALADAQAQTPPDTVGAQCYQALLNLKTNPAFALPTGTVVGAFTAIQKARDLKTQLANLASPTGPLANLNAACAAWTQDNVATLIAVGGAVGLIANPVGATTAATGAVAAFNAQIIALLAAIPK